MNHQIIGRQSELARIGNFLARIPSGSRTLVIEGDPGVGKTTLWFAGNESAASRGWRVLSARPSEAEATFAYAGIGDLLSPIDEAILAALPPPQRRALRVALLRDEPEGRAPDAHTIALAFLSALERMARIGPVLVAVDDAQWIDPPSALALAFAIRRMGDAPIGILVAHRTGEPAGWPLRIDRPTSGEPVEHLVAGPLALGPLGEILLARLGVAFPRATLQRLHDSTGGNVFFALELSRAVLAAPASLDAVDEMPLPDGLSSLLGDHLATLPPATQDALAIAAALSRPTVALIGRALDGPADALLAPAVSAHVVSIEDGAVRFSHPLRASAARSRASAARRREIHARLAAIVPDPEEAARHLALASTEPDPATAQALEDAARRAAARGAPDAACELAGLAVRRTPPGRRDDLRRRRMAEAEHARVAGDPVRARGILEPLLAESAPGPERAGVLALLTLVHVALDLRAALAVARAAIEEAGPDDRLRMDCEGMLTGALDNLGEDVPAALAAGYRELEIAERLGDDVHLATALRGIARNEQRLGGRMPVETIERALALEPAVRPVRTVITWPTRCHADMVAWTGDLAAALDEMAWLCRQAFDRGDEYSFGRILADMVPYECVAGRWEEALGHADECCDRGLAGQTNLRALALADRALVLAHRGDADGARQDADEARRLAAPLSVLGAERVAAWAMGLLELSLGDAAAAHARLEPLVRARRAAGIREPGELRAVPDDIEAMIGAGRLDDARDLFDWYDGLVRSSDRPYALAAADRCRGLSLGARGELAAGIDALERSRALFATIDEPLGLGRTLLALGSIQRRALRRHAARQSLEAALGLFERLGAALWAARARGELSRIGGRRAAGHELTPAERDVAALVAEGHTNREVAAALYVTERTVEGHLSAIYGKLGLSSRAELARRLSGGSESPQARG